MNFKENYKGIIFTVLLILVTIVLFKPSISANDGFGYYSYLVSISEDFDLDLENQYEYYESINPNVNHLTSEKTGKYYNQYTFGTALMWSPAYFTAHNINKIFNLNHSPYEDKSIYIMLITISNILFVYAGLFMLYKYLSKKYNSNNSIQTTILMMVTTPLIFYTYFQPTLSHGVSFFITSLFTYLFLNWHKNINLKKGLLLTICIGLIFLIRPQEVLFALIWIIYELYKEFPILIKKFNTKYLINLIIKYSTYLLLFAAIVLPQLLMWNYYHGDYLAGPSPELYKNNDGFANYPKYLPNHLFSPNHGIIYWNPIFIFSFIGLFFLIKDSIKKSNKNNSELIINILLIVGVLLQILYNSTTPYWSSGQSFGQRKFLSCIFVMGIGLASYINNFKKSKKIFRIINYIILIGLSIWNFSLLVQYGYRLIPSSGPVYFKEILYNTFMVLPNKIIEIIKYYFSI